MRVMHSLRRGRFLAAVTGALVSFVLATPAGAVPLLFTFTGADNGSFVVDSNPTPTFTDANSFVALVTSPTGDFAGAGGAEFYLTSGGGGLAAYVGPGASTLLSAGGPQLFTGTLANPVFAPGSFKLADPSTFAATSLTISGPGASAPELAGGLLAGVLAMAALAMTRRHGPRRAG